MQSRHPAQAPLAAGVADSMLPLMSPLVRHRPSPPSRAKRNIRWAAITMLALSLAPAASPERESHQADPALATEIAPDNELPFVAGGVELDHALDLGVDSVPLE
ncbi:MAG: hypothetical protein RLY21_910 [Planctomycetota bacterium]|jgi:hypothetical protein